MEFLCSLTEQRLKALVGSFVVNDRGLQIVFYVLGRVLRALCGLTHLIPR